MAITITKVTKDDTKGTTALDHAVSSNRHPGRFMAIATVRMTFARSFVTFVVVGC